MSAIPRATAAVFAAFLTTVTVPVVGTAPATATPPQRFLIRNAMTGRCLATNGVWVYTSSWCGGSQALWYTTPDPGGPVYTIRSYPSGACLNLDVDDRDINLGCARSTRVWYSVYNGAYDVIQNNADPEVLDSNSSGDVYPLQVNGGSYQQWLWIRYP